MATVHVDRITKRFGDGSPVLDDISLEVADGESLVLAGPSGSGKTTLLRVIAGLESPDQGRVIIGDRDVTSVPPGERDLAMVFQEHALYQRRTAESNIAFPLEVRRVGQEERHQRAVEEAESLQIEHVLSRYPSQLSAGHRQAVATARALIRDSRVLLMDEPLAHLDAKARAASRVELARLRRELGVTLLYVTNDQTEAMALADRIAVLDAGRLRQVAAPLEVYHRPADRLVGEFIGSPPMRMVSAELTKTPDGAELVIGSDRVRLEPGFLVEHPELADWLELPVTVGIRAEWLAESHGREPFDRCLHGEVIDVVDHGSETFVDVGVGAAGILTVRYPPGPLPLPGDQIELAVAVDRLRFFDPVSENTIG